MIVYLIGPISGRPDDNRSAFEALRTRIARTLTHVEIVIPHDLYTPQGEALRCPALRWCEAMIVCLGTVERASLVILVEGWQDSPGARRERECAQERGIACGEWTA